MTKVERLVERTADAMGGALRLSPRQLPGLKVILTVFADAVASERGLARRKPLARRVDEND